MTRMPLIEAENISFIYSNSVQKVIRNLSLKINAGEFVSVQGPSGSGKSTLLYLLADFPVADRRQNPFRRPGFGGDEFPSRPRFFGIPGWDLFFSSFTSCRANR